jgi:hypothetical protein
VEIYKNWINQKESETGQATWVVYLWDMFVFNEMSLFIFPFFQKTSLRCWSRASLGTSRSSKQSWSSHK